MHRSASRQAAGSALPARHPTIHATGGSSRSSECRGSVDRWAKLAATAVPAIGPRRGFSLSPRAWTATHTGKLAPRQGLRRGRIRYGTGTHGAPKGLGTVSAMRTTIVRAGPRAGLLRRHAGAATAPVAVGTCAGSRTPSSARGSSAIATPCAPAWGSSLPDSWYHVPTANSNSNRSQFPSPFRVGIWRLGVGSWELTCLRPPPAAKRWTRTDS
jgi:hypothetical protein